MGGPYRPHRPLALRHGLVRFYESRAYVSLAEPGEGRLSLRGRFLSLVRLEERDGRILRLDGSDEERPVLLLPHERSKPHLLNVTHGRGDYDIIHRQRIFFNNCCQLRNAFRVDGSPRSPQTRILVVNFLLSVGRNV